MLLFDLYELIENGENGNVEFKRKFSSPEKIAKEMIAFANTRGGKIIFGVDDDRSVKGVESEKEEMELTAHAANYYCEPRIHYNLEILHIYKKDVVVIDVPESKTKPHCLVENNIPDPTKVYIRIKDKSVLASKETINILKKSNPDAPPMIFDMGDKEKYLLDYLSKHDKITVKTLRELLNLSQRRASRILINLTRAELIRHHTNEKEDFYTIS